MKSKTEMPDYSPTEKIRLENQERGDIRNHFRVDRVSFGQNQPMIVETYISGKSYFLEEEQLIKLKQ